MNDQTVSAYPSVSCNDSTIKHLCYVSEYDNWDSSDGWCYLSSCSNRWYNATDAWTHAVG